MPRAQRHQLCQAGAIILLQFLEAASSGGMSPILTIIMTEYFAEASTGGTPINCGAGSQDKGLDKLPGCQAYLQLWEACATSFCPQC